MVCYGRQRREDPPLRKLADKVIDHVLGQSSGTHSLHRGLREWSEQVRWDRAMKSSKSSVYVGGREYEPSLPSLSPEEEEKLRTKLVTEVYRRKKQYGVLADKLQLSVSELMKGEEEIIDGNITEVRSSLDQAHKMYCREIEDPVVDIYGITFLDFFKVKRGLAETIEDTLDRLHPYLSDLTFVEGEGLREATKFEEFFRKSYAERGLERKISVVGKVEINQLIGLTYLTNEIDRFEDCMKSFDLEMWRIRMEELEGAEKRVLRVIGGTPTSEIEIQQARITKLKFKGNCMRISY